MKRLIWGYVVATVTLIAAALMTVGVRSASADPAPRTDVRSNLIGVWYGETTDAPYPQHLVTFHGDGTVDITNPTNVQQKKAYGAGTTDSKGSGTWYWDANRKAVVWWFVELNSNAITHKPAAQTRIVFVSRFDGGRPVSGKLSGPWLSVPDEEHHGTMTMTKQGVTEQQVEDVPGA